MKLGKLLAVSCVLIGLLGMTTLASASGYWSIQERYQNTTGQTANDLTKILWGNVNVVDAIHNPFTTHTVMHFGLFTIIHWSGANVPNGGFAWACFRANGPVIGRVLGAWWTFNGNFIGWAGPNLSIIPRMTPGGTVTVQITHEATNWSGTGYPPSSGDGPGTARGPVTISNAYYCNIGTTEYTLDQLNESLFTSLTWTPLSGGTLSNQQYKSWSVPGVLSTDHVLVRYDLSGDAATATDMAQFTGADAIPLPGMPWWGAYPLGLLLLAAGAYMLMRRRGSQTTAA